MMEKLKAFWAEWNLVILFVAILLIISLGIRYLQKNYGPETIVPTVTFDPTPYNDTIADLRHELELSVLEKRQMNQRINQMRTHEHSIVTKKATPFSHMDPAATDSTVVNRHLARADSLRAAGAGVGAVAF